jgi:hypothetical protein
VPHQTNKIATHVHFNKKNKFIKKKINKYFFLKNLKKTKKGEGWLGHPQWPGVAHSHP